MWRKRKHTQNSVGHYNFTHLFYTEPWLLVDEGLFLEDLGWIKKIDFKQLTDNSMPVNQRKETRFLLQSTGNNKTLQNK